MRLASAFLLLTAAALAFVASPAGPRTAAGSRRLARDLRRRRDQRRIERDLRRLEPAE
ncbi:MAG: hypothetical protein K1X87_00660 [Dehalococcoidia bacterium]|nr:hypothetical protein [Dehalococcoidia bacterium]